MSLVEQLHQERKARLARINAAAVLPPRRKPLISMTDVLAKLKAAKEATDYEDAWSNALCGCEMHETDVRKSLRLNDVLNAVSDYFGVPVADIQSHRRTAKVTRPRQVAMYLSRELTLRSFPEIGRRIGNRDHTTAMAAFRKIGDEMLIDPDLSDDIAALKRILTGGAK